MRSRSELSLVSTTLPLLHSSIIHPSARRKLRMRQNQSIRASFSQSFYIKIELLTSLPVHQFDPECFGKIRDVSVRIRASRVPVRGIKKATRGSGFSSAGRQGWPYTMPIPTWKLTLHPTSATGERNSWEFAFWLP